MEDDEEAVWAEEVQLAGLGEEEAAQGAGMGVAEALGQAGGETVEHVGGVAAEPGVERQGGGREAWLLGVVAALVVTGRRGVDEGIVKQDAMSLLVMLALTEALDELVGGRFVVAEDPQRVPAIFFGAAAALLTDDEGADVDGAFLRAARVGERGDRLGDVDDFGRRSDEGTRFFDALPGAFWDVLPGGDVVRTTRSADDGDLLF